MMMNYPNSGFKPSIFYFATAVAITAVMSDAVFAHGEANPLQIDVTGSQEGGQRILIPSKIVAGDELQNKFASFTLAGGMAQNPRAILRERQLRDGWPRGLPRLRQFRSRDQWRA